MSQKHFWKRMWQFNIVKWNIIEKNYNYILHSKKYTIL